MQLATVQCSFCSAPAILFPVFVFSSTRRSLLQISISRRRIMDPRTEYSCERMSTPVFSMMIYGSVPRAIQQLPMLLLKRKILHREILEDLKANPETHGGPPDCILLCQLREQVLRELGFRDIFKKVKDDENAKAISLFEEVVRLNDAIEDGPKRVENLIRGILAGNIFDLGSAQLAEVFSRDGMSFLASCQNLVPRPRVIDDLDNFKLKWSKKSWKKAVIFVDNSGADIILGIIPFVMELLPHGTRVVLAANDLPSINDITYHELVEIIAKLTDENGKLMGVDASGLLIANSGNDLPFIDLSAVSAELAYLASDADLVMLEGMGRALETNLYAPFKCDSIKIGMVKHLEVAQFLGGRLYDCVFNYKDAPSY